MYFLDEQHIRCEGSKAAMASNRFLKSLKGALRTVPDRLYLQLYYFAKFRKFCNFRTPSTYNEKLQWLKLNYRISEHSKLVDKYAVKEVVAGIAGDKYVLPTLGLYESADDIDFDKLPESFVLKCTHDSEGVILVESKTLLNQDEARSTLRRALARDFFAIGREPHYQNLQPRIIAEPFLVDETQGQLLDYKFFCFDGEVKAMYVASDRSSGLKFDYFDARYSPLNIRQSYPNSEIPPSKPSQFEEMIQLAQKLSQGHPHVRVDLYQANGRVYFGELTFFHFSGFAPFHPSKWDKIWGDWLNLPDPV